MLKVKLTLRVFSNYYNLSEVTQVLGQPDKGFSLGDAYGKSNKKREATLWSKRTSLLETDSLELHIKEIISFICSKSQAVKSIGERCEFDLFCMLRSDNGQGAASLTPSIMGELNSYGIGITLDVYCDE